MTDYTWTQTGRRWTLDAAPRYAVQSRELGRSTLLIDGYEVDTVDTLPVARAKLECTFEYEEHYAELELARLRLRQARDRLAERYPRAAADGQLASILESLGDALGIGPEATEPHYAEAQKTDVFRQQASPDLTVAVDAAGCMVLEVTDGLGRVLRRVTVGDLAALKELLSEAYQQQSAVIISAHQDRQRGIDDARRARGRLTKSEAVEWLIGEDDEGMGRSVAVTLVNGVQCGRAVSAGLAGMTYDGTYWVVPTNTEQTAR